jgi:hypothetical protein
MNAAHRAIELILTFLQVAPITLLSIRSCRLAYRLAPRFKQVKQ